MNRLSCLILLDLCLLTARIFGQSTNATVSGGVTDPAGQFVVGADIDIVNDETGVGYAVQTNSSGIYSVPILPPGHYHVQVSKRGFKTIIKPDVVLNVQSALALNFTLPVGSTAESITVDAASSLMNTTDASVSTVIDRQFVEKMPLNGRSFQDLISMTPGVVTQSPQSQGQVPGKYGDFSVNGQRTESNYYTVDGVSANLGTGQGAGVADAGNSGSVSASTALGTTQSLISVDALQEFRVLSSTYSAEYGRTPGGQFSLLTRSGTNAFHGTVFDYLRNNFFDANDWFNNHAGKAMTPLRQNDFGGTVGGPVWIPRVYQGRKKTFFFASYEGLRLTQPQAASILYVPNANLRQNSPAVLQPLLNAFPVQNGKEEMIACTVGAGSTFPCPSGTPAGTLVQSGLADFLQPYSLPATVNSTSIRLDHNFNSKVSAFFRFGNTPSSTQSRVLSVVSEQTTATQTYTLGVTSQLASKLTNEFRGGYADSGATLHKTLDWFGGAQPVDLATSLGAGAYEHPNPNLYFYFLGVGTTFLQTQLSKNQGRQWNIVDTFNLPIGRHQIKYGFDYRRIVSPLVRPTPLVEPYFAGPTAVLTNTEALYVFVYGSGTPIYNETAAFIQDEWRATSRLTLSGGLRWEVNPPPREANGNDPYTLLGDVGNPSSLKLAPQGIPLWKTTWFNLAPRLGVAWQMHPKAGWETVLRTGGGVFFDTDNQLATQGFNGIGFYAFQSYTNVHVPATPTQIGFAPSTSAPYTSTSVYAFPSHLQLPYTFQWNASIQQSLGNQQALTITYVGSNGRRLIQSRSLSVHALNPNFGTIVYMPNGVSSSYNALQLQFQRSVAHGLNALASYTWSHSLDFGSNNAALPTIRGNSDFDVRNNFQAGLSWTLLHPAYTGMMAALANDWGVDLRVAARTGFPVNILGTYLTDVSSGNQYYSGVNLISGQPIYRYDPQYAGGRILNKAAFALPTGTSVGNAPRNFVRGFDATQINLAVRRSFPLYENLRLEFRAEAFNVLNHPNFGFINSTYTDALFGQATKMLNQSLGTVSSQYQQGGPRSMQFALKLLF